MEKIYYISQGKTAEEHLQNIKKVCAGGIKLVQLRMKGFSEQEYAKTALEAVEILHEFGGKLIVNDNFRVAYAANADGVHLGQNDSAIGEARKLLGREKIIGGTANTVLQCEELVWQGVDYLGVGPFCFTQTKQNLSPVLGLEGYINLMQRLSISEEKPIYAIGGITEQDIPSLLGTGISGVAISGALTKMSLEEIKMFNEKFRK